MKKRLFLAFAMLMTVCSFCWADDVVIAEIDWTQESAYYSDVWYDNTRATLDVSENGLEIKSNPPENANYREPTVPMIAHLPDLNEGVYYQVKFTLDAPASGEIQLDLCSWDGSGANQQCLINVEQGLHEYTVYFNNYPTSCTNAMIFYQCGLIPGKHIIKNVQVRVVDYYAYAVYDSNTKTLTFYYDDQKEDRDGIVYNDLSNFLWKDQVIQKVVFDSSFSNARPTSTFYWFYQQSELTSIEGIEYLNTSEVTTMNGMFQECSSLESIDLSGFNTSKVTNMNCMFHRCSGLKELNLISFDTSNVTDLAYMFMDCSNLTTIYVSAKWVVDSDTKSTGMFYNCNNLVGCAGTVYDADKTDKAYARIDEGSSYPGYLSAIPEAYALYDNHANIKTLTFYYDGLRYTARRMGTTYDLNVDEAPGWITDNCYIEKVVFDESFKNARPTSTYNWFFGMNNLTSLDLGNLNTSEVTNMYAMFDGCSSLETITFGEAFNTNCVTDMGYMFYGCSSLTELDLSNFDTSNVTYMALMFYGCTNLTKLDLSNFDTSDVTNMGFMFIYCSSLTALDLCSFNTCNVTNMESMFESCISLATITVGKNWKTGSVTDSSNMFWQCGNLKGGAGTVYDSSKIDKEYAHVDGLGGPGYLTAVSYGITVDGKAVTFANKYDVLGNETVYYDDSNNTLTLNHAQLSVVNVTETAPDNLLIEVNGNCTITAQLGNAFTTSIKTTTIEGAGKLTITSEKGIGIYMPLKKTSRLMVRNIELVVQGKTCGIQGNYSGRIFYTDLGFDNVKCTVQTTGLTSKPSVAIINDLRTKNCTMTQGQLQNNSVSANPMVIERDGAGITTGVERLNDNGEMINDKARDAWYTIDGQKLNGKPAKKGIYIHNGKKVVKQ